MIRVIEGMIPPGGWHYMQGDVRVPAGSYTELLQAVLEHRLQNRVPVGNVKADVDQYVCSNYPSQCNGVGAAAQGGQSIPQTPPPNKVTDLLTQWAIELHGKKGVDQTAPETEANARAEKCLQCPQNKPWPPSCERCKHELDRVLTMLRRGKDCQHWRRLNICAASNQDCRTIVWLKKDLLKTPNPKPAICWL